MVTETQHGWRDLRAEMTRADVTLVALAETMGLSYAKLAGMFASEGDTDPRPEFAEKVLEAIKKVAASR